MIGASGVCDLIITTTMLTFVSHHIISLNNPNPLKLLFPQLLRAKTSFHGTNTMLNRLITLTVETGMLTAVATWVEIVLLVVRPQDNLHLIMYVYLTE